MLMVVARDLQVPAWTLVLDPEAELQQCLVEEHSWDASVTVQGCQLESGVCLTPYDNPVVYQVAEQTGVLWQMFEVWYCGLNIHGIIRIQILRKNQS